MKKKKKKKRLLDDLCTFLDLGVIFSIKKKKWEKKEKKNHYMNYSHRAIITIPRICKVNLNIHRIEINLNESMNNSSNNLPYKIQRMKS